MPPPGIDSRL